MEKETTITLFRVIVEEEDEYDKDIYDEIPDFTYYERHGFVGWAAIQEITRIDETIILKGILKGNQYPEKVTISLPELESYSMIALADYLQQM